MYELTAIEDLDPTTQVIAVRAQGLREQNVAIMNQIERFGGSVDLATARQEHLIGYLVKLGVITEHAMWEIALEWEESLRPQLKGILDEAGKRISAAAVAAAKDRGISKLIVPERHRK